MKKWMMPLVACALLSVLASRPGWAAPAPTSSHSAVSPSPGPFQQGTEAYRAGHYSDALRFFQQAKERDGNSDQLQYNIGVTYYRLNDFPNSRATFEALAQRPKLAPIAHYNLGLIAKKTHDPKRARAEFEITAKTATNPRLRHLAKKQLRHGSAGKKSRAKK